METNQIVSIIGGDLVDLANVNKVNPWTLMTVAFTFQEGNNVGRDYAFNQLENAIEDGFTTQAEIDACEEIVEQMIADLEY